MAPPVALPSSWRAEWDGCEPLVTPQGPVMGGLVAEGGEPAGRLVVQSRQGGERLRLPGRGSRDLKRLLQELDVPPWRRRQLLVVWQGETVAAVFDPRAGCWLACAEGWRAGP